MMVSLEEASEDLLMGKRKEILKNDREEVMHQCLKSRLVDSVEDSMKSSTRSLWTSIIGRSVLCLLNAGSVVK